MSTRKKPDASPFEAHKARLKRLRAALKANGHEHFLITAPNDIRYLTGFSGEDSFALVSPKSFHVISDFRFNEQLDAIKLIAKVVLRDGLMHETVRALLADLSIDTLAIQSETVTVAQKTRYTKLLKGVKLVDTEGVVSKLRVIKDAAEVSAIRKAAGIQQKALLQVLEEIGPGMTESRVAAKLEFAMKSLGSEGTGFNTIAAARTNSAIPHAVTGNTKTAKNKPLLIDFGAIHNGYRSDMTRVFNFGTWNTTIHEIYSITLEAHEAAAAALRPGLSGRDADAVARNIIAKAGYGEQFGHGLGHGLGLDIHEDPRLSKQSTDVLEEGMVVTVEPGIYIQGLGGVRIEDDYVITKTGAKNLCTLPKDIGWATR
ncbi:MAG: Xaa-Pro peptidase family protein [Phycisphaerales bacterium]